ncbi:hypothetical protein JANAI61_37480 [Jannaschia sp. AI_61]|uniref:polysaccharide biosynthesis/export family protein n=1 Tax=Jannaschia sp. AI_61 TaxID=2829796 RepID=UPI001BC38B4D|nr:polysaccharide biosynthesis/export family protein [Jannaschia sp. AI_61]GIT93290.1 hypothetical protein JANAI61_37480 [Jannaschia sp. AI_61]
MPFVRVAPVTGLGRAFGAYVSLALLAVFAWVLVGPAAAQGYRTQPGDLLRVEVLEDESLNRTVLIAPDGRISVPQAGTIRAAGRTVEAIQADLISRLAGNFAAPPNVFVALQQLAPPAPPAPVAAPLPPAPPPTISVFIVGEANQTGEIEVAPGTTVLQMFGVMGGFTKFAASGRVQLRRGDTVYTLSYPAIEAGRSGNGRVVLADGDVLVIPQRRLFE